MRHKFLALSFALATAGCTAKTGGDSGILDLSFLNRDLASTPDLTGVDLASAAHCTDGKLDGDETDVDCGGSCKKCGDGKACISPGDCASGVCTGGTCKAATCMDG